MPWDVFELGLHICWRATADEKMVVDEAVAMIDAADEKMAAAGSRGRRGSWPLLAHSQREHSTALVQAEHQALDPQPQPHFARAGQMAA